MHENMNMIWHHTPCKQFVTFVMKMKHRVLGNFSNLWITQMTLADAPIKILLQFRALLADVLDDQQMLPFTPA